MIDAALPPPALPGPRALPVLGAYGNFLGMLRDPAVFLPRLYRSYGPIASLARGTSNYVFVFTPQYNQYVLSQPDLFGALDISASPVRVSANPALAQLFTGLTQMNGERHRRQRRLIMPALAKKRVSSSCETIAELADRRLSRWRLDRPRDLFQDMRAITLAIAVRTLVGLDAERDGSAFCMLLDGWMRRVFSLPALALPWDLPGLPYARLCRESERLVAATAELIERKRALGEDHGDALSMLLRAHDEDGAMLSAAELIGQTATLFVAGHEITARVLSWTLLLLAQHPRIYADVVDELDATLRGAAPAAEQLNRLPLLQAVIKESMRLLPPVMWWSRIASAPFQLGPYQLPRGTQVAYSPFVTHRLAELYPQARRFIPQRWFGIDPGPYEFLPFSAGPRMCPGAFSAMLHMKIVLALLLQRYRITLCRGARIDRGGLMLSGPQPGLPAWVSRQDRRFVAGRIRGSVLRLLDMP